MRPFTSPLLVASLLMQVAAVKPPIGQEPEIKKTATPAVKPAASKASWHDILTTKLKAIESAGPSKSIGLYLKDLESGEEFSFRGDEYWYIASGTKLPVALEVLRAVDAGILTLDTRVEIFESDYVDGAGELNYIKPGSQVSVRLLLEQSLIFSDNTASDILIRLVGIEKVNELVSALVPKGFAPITTLAEVRRRVFTAFHPDAGKLSNMDFIRIKSIKGEKEKLERLAKLLNLKTSDFKHQSFDSAFAAYYSERVNSATLRGYGVLLEKVAQGAILKEDTRAFLRAVLERAETGKSRIKAGLPKSFVFAHKTGTQHERICDFGLLSTGKPSGKKILIATCVRDLPLEKAETQMRQVGQAINEVVFSGKESQP